jgi:hypothetical protein
MATDIADICARLGDAWFRDHSARIEQRHLQFGRHSPLDVGSLLLRVTPRVPVARRAEVAARDGVPTAPAPSSRTCDPG